MQSFLPYTDFRQCALVLDRQRLGKQRVECLQILNTLTGRSTGWQNHPAVRMWRGYEAPLFGYALTICREWISRGYKDTCTDKLLDMAHADDIRPSQRAPRWITPALTLSHQSNLLRKLPDHYRPIFGLAVPDDLPYLWPV